MKNLAIIRAAGAAALSVALLALLSRGRPWFNSYSVRFLLLPVAAAAIAFVLARKSAKAGPDCRPDPGGAALAGWILTSGMILCLCSTAANDVWFYFMRWNYSPEGGLPFHGTGMVRFCVIAAVLVPILAFWHRPRQLTGAILAIAMAVCAWQLWRATGGRPVWSDDHPAFMHRLWACARSFPRLVYYDPTWNGGRDATYAISSGTVPVAALFWPLLRLFPVDQVYTPILIAAFIVLTPLLAVLSARIAGANWSAAFGGGVLALGISHLYFLWLLHFGTIGSSLSSAFLMPVLACLYRILWLDKHEWWAGVVLVLSSVVFLAWPPSSVMALPLIPALLFGIPRLNAKKMVFLAKCALASATLLLPVAAGTLLHAKHLSDFVASGTHRPEFVETIARGWKELHDHLWRANPCLVFLGIAGVWLLPWKGMSRFYGTVIAGLCFIACVGDAWKPHLQLSRAGTPMLFAAALPASLWIGRILEIPAPLWMSAMRPALIALLILIGVNTARIYGNKGPARFYAISQETLEMTEWIKDNTPQGARVMFAGRTVHGYGRGHVAMLPVLTGREMMACDYYHFSPSLVEYEYPPMPFRGSEAGVSEFLELYNVACILTFHEKWKAFFRKQPELYEESRSFGDRLIKTAFKVKRQTNIFLRGSGKVVSNINELRVTLDDPDREAVIQYDWVNGLSPSRPAEIVPFDAGHGLKFIAIRPNGAGEVTIRYKKWM